MKNPAAMPGTPQVQELLATKQTQVADFLKMLVRDMQG